MSQQTFVLPDVGEGLTEAEIVSWKVAAGDTIELNQVLVEIETAKSLVELPSPYAGTVAEVLVAEGVTVEVGAPLIRVATTGADGAPGAADGGEVDAVAALVADTAGTVDHEDDAPAPLVGYGSGGHGPTRRHSRHPGVPSTEPRPGSASRPAAQDATGREAAAQAAAVLVPGASAVPVIAKPPVRKLAKDLGVDLTVVTATGPIGEVTREDVIREAHQASVFHNIETPEWPETREDRIPVKGVRKAIATAMVTSAFTAPHVSVFTDVDATRTMEFVARLKNSPDFAGVKVSPLLIMAKAIIWAVQRNPTVNSTWTDEEIIVHHFVNLGVAAATPRGLIVPNVKEAQGMSLRELAEALQELTLTAREGRTQPVEMAGGTITVTNIGVFGMDTGTPILNPGEVAIVALGTIKQRPWVVDGEVRPRYVTTVGASFDHRVVDGDVASRFTADVAAIMEEPALLLD